VEQAGLADAGIAADPDDLPLAAQRGLKPAEQEVELVTAPDEGREASADHEPDPLGPGNGERPLPSDPGLPEVEAAHEERLRRRAEQDGAGLATLHQRVERVERLPPGLLGQLGRAGALPHEKLPRVDPERRDRRRLVLPPRLLEGSLDGERGQGGAARRVLHRLEAERGHDAAGAHAHDAAAEAPDLVDHHLDRAARLERRLGRRRHAERRAQEGHAPPLPAERRRRPRRRRGRRRGDRGRWGRRLPRRGPRPPRRRPLFGEPVLRDARAQRVARDPEPGGGARDVPPRLAQRLGDALAHGVLERAGAPGRRRGGGRGGHRRRARHRGQAKRLGGDLALGREQRDPLHEVRELPHVARPRVGPERGERPRGESLGRHPVVRARARQEVLGEPHDVLAAVPERRQGEREHREAVVEVLAEAPLADRPAQVLVGRGEHPHVDRLVPRAAEPAHAALLERLQELGLERLGQEPDLVEEDRAAVRGLEEARLGAPRVGEGAALVAEHLGFEQGLGDRRAVDVHEGPIRARPGPMDHPGEQPLARAGLALDQDRRQAAHVVLALQ